MRYDAFAVGVKRFAKRITMNSFNTNRCGGKSLHAVYNWRA